MKLLRDSVTMNEIKREAGVRIEVKQDKWEAGVQIEVEQDLPSKKAST